MPDRTHKKPEIRQAIVNILTDSIPSVEERVYANRRTGVAQETLPVILVYTNTERIEELDNVNRKRTLTVSIEAQAAGENEEECMETLDMITAEIEIALQNYDTLDGLVHHVELTQIEEALDDGGENIIGGARLQFEVEYYTEKTKDPVEDEAQFIVVDGGINLESELEQ
jgi:hypothetical protein